MTKRTQKSTGEVISTIVFALMGLVLLSASMDPAWSLGERAMMGLGALGGFAAAGRFAIAQLLSRKS